MIDMRQEVLKVSTPRIIIVMPKNRPSFWSVFFTCAAIIEVFGLVLHK